MIRIGEPLALEDVEAVARGGGAPRARTAAARVGAARDRVERAVASGETVYGVTTGFGSLASVAVPAAEATELQHAIVRSHATAVGPLLSREEARAMLLLRAQVLARGNSGVRVEVIERMLAFLARDLVPAVPEQGSLGASGDLAPLACLALPLIGGGSFLGADGAAIPAAEVLAASGFPPLALGAKEGLALVNGTQGMLAIGTLALLRLERLARTADVVAAMTIEAALGSDRPFDARLHALRPHPGQVASASNLRRLL
ncbi:MAG: aromatic amino acid lyase, partial [Actinomycetota bacterium]